MENFYKLYLKENGCYQRPEIYQSKRKLDERLSRLDQEYLLIHRHDDYDEIISHKEAKVKLVDNVKSNIKVNAITFTTEDIKKKRKLRKEERRKLQEEIDKYIDK